MSLLLGLRSPANRAIITNASSLVGTTAINSLLGFVYWWLAARQFSADAVGVASAAVSAMTLLGTIGMLGFGTLLIGELPRQPGKEGSLITTALSATAVAGGILGIVFTIVASVVSADLDPLSASLRGMALFALGVSLTSVVLVTDQALIGLLRGELQFVRNAVFAAAKLGALFAVTIWLSDRMGLTIYATWVAGNVLSLVVMGWLAMRRAASHVSYQPQWRMLRRLGRAALSHHALNLALQAPGLALPVVVTTLLSARLNAYFYIAWMVASFAFVGPVSLTTSLFAVGARAPAALANKIRFTIGIAIVVGVAANAALLVGGSLVLGLFGHAYAEQAAGVLSILALGVFPLIVKNHYVAICRVQNHVARAALYMGIGGLLELAGAVAGASIGALPGLSLGWLAAVCMEAAFVGPVVYWVGSGKKAQSPHPNENPASSPAGTGVGDYVDA